MKPATQGLLLIALLWCWRHTILLAKAQVTLTSLRVENYLAPAGHFIEPLFSWTPGSPEREITQTSYQVLVSKPHPGGEEVWNSGVTASNRTQLIKYTGPQLRPDTRYIWSVNASTSSGIGVAYSDFVTDPFPGTGSDVNPWLGKRDPLSSELLRAFYSSSWIWTADANSTNAPAGKRAFRYTFVTPAGKTAASALVMLSADNSFSLYVNGIFVGTHGDWRLAHSYNVTLHDTAQNVFAIRSNNVPPTKGQPNPAGVVAAIQVTFTDGTTTFLSSDDKWRSNNYVPGFELPSFIDVTWPPAKIVAKYGENPWGAVKIPIGTQSTVTQPFSSSTTPTASSSDTPPMNGSPSNASIPVGAIVGGVIGAISILLLFAFFILWRKRHFRRNTTSLNHEPFTLTSRSPGVVQHGSLVSTHISSAFQPTHFSNRPDIRPYYAELRDHPPGIDFATTSMDDNSRGAQPMVQGMVNELRKQDLAARPGTRSLRESEVDIVAPPAYETVWE